MDEFPLSTRMGDREAVAILNRLRAANARADRLEAKLAAVVSAVRACYLALDHGTPNTLAVGQAFTAIEQALGMRWKPGEERERREKEGGGE